MVYTAPAWCVTPAAAKARAGLVYYTRGCFASPARAKVLYTKPARAILVSTTRIQWGDIVIYLL